MPGSREIRYLKNVDCVIDELCKLIETIGNESIEKSNIFKIGLSGGSLIGYLKKGLPSIKTDWSKWLVFFCDERVVPFDDEESTFGLCQKQLLGILPLTVENFVRIDPTLSAQDAAIDYANKLKIHFPGSDFPSFDLLLLGMGPDGHTCSLFPGHTLLKEDKLWIAPISDSPKPPPSRVTMTLPVVNNANICIFPISGHSKAEMIKRILKNSEELPAGLVKPTKGIVYWLLDDTAASLML